MAALGIFYTSYIPLTMVLGLAPFKPTLGDSAEQAGLGVLASC